MYIKEIVIEGFKSYAQRTVITGFDQLFNAITGLNGSGKSNILDAICFVLGLTQLTHARVSSLQELIYKFGHAGITKASVTLILDNSDPEHCPPGYDQYKILTVTRQIISSGVNVTSKYFLNGTKITSTNIKNIFKCVHLNIDNPHFLVQQGKITKVINLRPKELISMLEETAGTSLYNNMKAASKKLIQKKEAKVNEMSNVLMNEIEPQMKKLREERDNYFLWKEGQKDLKKVEKILTAAEYHTMRKEQGEKQFDLTDTERNRNEISEEIQELEIQQKTVTEEIDDAQKQQRNAQSNETYKELESKYKEKKTEITNLESEITETNKEMKKRKKEQKSLSSKIHKLTANVKLQEDKLDFQSSIVDKFSNQIQEKKEYLQEAKRTLEEGIKVDQIKHKLNQNIKENKLRLNNVTSEIKQKQVKMKHLQNDLENQKNALVTSKQDVEKIEDNLQKINIEIDQHEIELKQYQNRGEDIKTLKEEHNTLLREKNMMNNQLLKSQSPIFNLNYKKPEPNFDSKKIYGKVFQLFKVKENRFLKPLEAIAGGKLKQIVVDNQQTAKTLLKKKCFRSFVVLIPNNKIRPMTISRSVIERAENIAADHGGFAKIAYELISFPDYLLNTMKYVFGGTFVCSSTEIAKKVAFDPYMQKKCKCVNLEGDITDPRGTLSGGYFNQQNSLLVKYGKFLSLRTEYQLKEVHYNRVNARYQEAQEELDKIQKIQNDLKFKSHKKKKLEKKLVQHQEVHKEEKIISTENKLKNFQKEIVNLGNMKDSYETDIDKLKKEIENWTGGQNKEVQLKVVKKEIRGLQIQLKKAKNELHKIQADQESNKQDCEKKTNDLVEEKEKESKLQDNFNKLTEKVTVTKNLFKDLEEQKRQIDLSTKQVSKKLQQLDKQITKINNKHSKKTKEFTKYEAVFLRTQKGLQQLNEKIAEYEKKFLWIASERELFGKKDTQFDFESMELKKMKEDHEKILEQQNNLKKKVNMKVEAMSDKVEKEYKSLIEKRDILQMDKLTINKNIEELDKKKKTTLEKCYLEVNKKFGKIFSSLLPGCNAKLQKIEGKDLSHGLELHVAFDGVWKQSLSELSGGQRSLLALSFILSLLRFKPAPFYILDEIDAALDLSHTENIGNMLAQHFPDNQFILISLKEGMYNNANVLFKTSFVDGVSKVDRYVLNRRKTKKKRKKKIYLEEADEIENNIPLVAMR